MYAILSLYLILIQLPSVEIFLNTVPALKLPTVFAAHKGLSLITDPTTVVIGTPSITVTIQLTFFPL